MPSANSYLEGLTLDSLLEDYFYSEARALAVARLETSATTGLIDIEGPPVNDEADTLRKLDVDPAILFRHIRDIPRMVATRDVHGHVLSFVYKAR